MIAQIVTFICLASLSYGLPVYDGLGYAPAASYSYSSLPVAASLKTIAIPKPVAISAPIYHAPAPVIAHAPVYHAPAPVYHAPAPVYHAPAPVIAHHAPIVKQVVAEPYDPNPQYSFSYGVTDPHTGDSKHAEETLVDGVVHGSYSLAEPDGSIRKVSYTADKINGFNAVVEKKGVAAPVAKIVTPAVPAVAKIYAPSISYHNPYDYH